MSERAKCVVEDGILRPCRTLDAAVEAQYGERRKGVTWLALAEFPEGAPMRTTRTGAVLQSGEFVTRGLLMNYCPFCGESIGHQFRAADTKAKDGEEP